MGIKRDRTDRFRPPKALGAALVVGLLAIASVFTAIVPSLALTFEEYNKQSYVDIVLHHRYARDSILHEIVNDGIAKDSQYGDKNSAKGLNNVVYAAFQATDKFDSLIASGLDKKDATSSIYEEINKVYREQGDSATVEYVLANYPLVDSALTKKVDGEDGVAKFKLEKHGYQLDSDGHKLVFDASGNPIPLDSSAPYAKYIFIEMEQPPAVLDKTTPLLLVLPFMSNDQESLNKGEEANWLNEIHMYSKNYLDPRDVWFVKHDLGNEAKKLAGTQFVLYKLDGDTKRYLFAQDPDIYSISWVDKSQATVYEANKNGVVSTASQPLPPGTYYFEEIKAVTGYVIDPAALKVKVVVPSDLTKPTTINGVAVPKISDGVEYDIHAAPKVTNDTVPVVPPPPPPHYLPSTGEMIKYGAMGAGILIIGIGLAAVAVRNHKKKQNI
ncbi:MAG: hypothetical protein LBN08_03645 [Lactobacillales bacterium]|jgi:hypothetical protein|nr:hypothetical protein [Lactobacillales bacterium]